MSEIMAILPLSIKRVGINGVSEERWFGYGVNPSIIIFTTFASLPGLTELNLLRSRNALTDETLQYICSSMTQLRTLEFSNCDGVTDFGVTGKKGTESTGISLQKLKSKEITSYYSHY